MFKNILVPTDFTEKSHTALDIALKISKGEKFVITLLHVIETIDDADEEEFDEFYRKLKERAQQKIDEIAGLYPEYDGCIMKEILFGSRVREIVKFAHEKSIDLIVLSSHRIDRMEAAADWATISYKVAILAQCPVLIAK
jgi:nucleotide-binding universal stress UspA family protein